MKRRFRPLWMKLTAGFLVVAAVTVALGAVLAPCGGPRGGGQRRRRPLRTIGRRARRAARHLQLHAPAAADPRHRCGVTRRGDDEMRENAGEPPAGVRGADRRALGRLAGADRALRCAAGPADPGDPLHREVVDGIATPLVEGREPTVAPPPGESQWSVATTLAESNRRFDLLREQFIRHRGRRARRLRRRGRKLRPRPRPALAAR